MLCHRRQPSPESPRVYVAEAPKPTSRFPPNDLPPLRLDELADYLRDFNRTHVKIKAHVVAADRYRKLSCPLLLRFSIRDALVVFLSLDEADGKSLLVENATAFASREQVMSTPIRRNPRTLNLSTRNLHIPSPTSLFSRSSHSK